MSEQSSELKEKVLMWLATGRVGASSKCMALTAIGLPASGSDYPRDPDDFNRCLLMVKACPEVKEHFPAIAELGPYWKGVIENWDAIEKSFIDEVGWNWSKARKASRTYELMDAIFKPLYKAHVPFSDRNTIHVKI